MGCFSSTSKNSVSTSRNVARSALPSRSNRTVVMLLPGGRGARNARCIKVDFPTPSAPSTAIFNVSMFGCGSGVVGSGADLGAGSLFSGVKESLRGGGQLGGEECWCPCESESAGLRSSVFASGRCRA